MDKPASGTLEEYKNAIAMGEDFVNKDVEEEDYVSSAKQHMPRRERTNKIMEETKEVRADMSVFLMQGKLRSGQFKLIYPQEFILCRGVLQGNAYGCGAFGAVDEHRVKTVADEFELVAAVMSAAAGDVLLVLQLAEHKVDHGLHLGVGIVARLVLVVRFLCRYEAFKILNPRLLQKS